MLNLTMKQNDDILLYERETGRLMGVVSCSRSTGQVGMQFRMNSNIVVLRKVLVTKLTEDIQQCPKALLESFGNK